MHASATKVNTDRQYMIILWLLSLVQKIFALILGFWRSWWSGRAACRDLTFNSSPPLTLQTQRINIGVSQAGTRRFHLGTAKITGGYEEGSGIEFYGLPLSLHCTNAITKEEMPTAAASVSERTKAVGSLRFPTWLDNQYRHYLHNLLKLIQKLITRQQEQNSLHCKEDNILLSCLKTVTPLTRKLRIYLT